MTRWTCSTSPFSLVGLFLIRVGIIGRKTIILCAEASLAPATIHFCYACSKARVFSQPNCLNHYYLVVWSYRIASHHKASGKIKIRLRCVMTMPNSLISDFPVRRSPIGARTAQHRTSELLRYARLVVKLVVPPFARFYIPAELSAKPLANSDWSCCSKNSL